MPKISYRCKPEERSKTIAERTHWDVYYGQKRIGFIAADGQDISKDRSHSVRIWKARMVDGFNTFEYPHVDDANKIKEEPFIITNDNEDVEHNLELINPQYMTMAEARKWVSGIHKGK